MPATSDVLKSRRLWLAAALVVLAGVAKVSYSNYTSQMNEFIGVPSPALVAAPETAGIPGLANVRFPARGGGPMVAGWYAPSRNGAAVIVAHGTQSERTSMLAETRLLAEAGFGVLAIDWPSYGASQGANNWGASSRAALVGAIDWLVATQHIDIAKLGGFGFSMGGFIMTQVAASEPRLHAVVLAAPVPDVVWQAGYEHSKWGFLSRWPAFLALHRASMPIGDAQPIEVIGRIAPRPLLLIVGADDRTVPAEKLREMFAAAAEPKAFWLVPGAGHGGYFAAAPSAYPPKIAGFFACHLLGQCPQP